MKRTIFASIVFATLIAFTAPSLIYADDEPAPTPTEPSPQPPSDPPPSPTPGY